MTASRARGSHAVRARPQSAEIAEALVLSPHTVQDHVKSLYEKVGVGSRQELVARVFLDEYLPEVLADADHLARALRSELDTDERNVRGAPLPGPLSLLLVGDPN